MECKIYCASEFGVCTIYKHSGIYIDGKGAKNGKYNAIEWKCTNNINNIPWTIYNQKMLQVYGAQSAHRYSSKINKFLFRYASKKTVHV